MGVDAGHVLSIQINMRRRNERMYLPDEIIESDDWASNIQRRIQHIDNIIHEGVEFITMRNSNALLVVQFSPFWLIERKQPGSSMSLLEELSENVTYFSCGRLT
jgi:hypothetical protein